MTDTKKKLRSLFLAMLMVTSVFGATVAFSGSALAGNAGNVDSTTVDNDSPGATTSYTFDITVDGTDDVSGDTLDDSTASFTVDAEAHDLGNVGQGNVTVEINGSTYNVDSASSFNNDGSLNISIEDNSGVGLNSGTQINLTLNDVQNPQSEGTYEFDVTVYGSQSTYSSTVDIGSASDAGLPDTPTDNTTDVSVAPGSSVNVANVDYDDAGSVSSIDFRLDGPNSTDVETTDVETVDVTLLDSNGDVLNSTTVNYDSLSETLSYASDQTDVAGVRLVANTDPSADVTTELDADYRLNYDGASVALNTDGIQNITDDTGFVSGRISDSNNNDVENATVSFIQNGTVRKTTQTNSAGDYTVELASPENYTVRVEKSGFSTVSSEVQTVTGDTVTKNVVIQRILFADEITVEPQSDSALTGENITYTVTVFDQSGDPISNIQVNANSSNSDITFGGAATATNATVDDGTATFTVNSSVIATGTLTFEATNTSGTNPTATADAAFIQNGEGAIDGQVFDSETTEGLPNATVYAVLESRYNNNKFTNNTSIAADDDNRVFVRLVDNSTGEIIDNNEYDIRTLNDSKTGVRKVEALNQTDAAVGQGFVLVDVDGDGYVNFSHTRLEDRDYYAQLSLDANNVSDERVADDSPENFTNVTNGSGDVVVFEPSESLTAATAQERSGLTGANLIDTTDEDGDFKLTKLFTNYQQGEDYVVVAQQVGYSTDFADVFVQEDGSQFDSRQTKGFNLEPEPVTPDFVNITQVGTHPPLAETDGEPNPDLISDFQNQSDDKFQSVPRDGTVDVIRVNAAATGPQGSQQPVDTNVTVELNRSFDGQFVGALDGEVVANDQENATITVSTGDDGEARVLLETVQNDTNLDAMKTATLEENTAVTDSSNVTFLGTIELESGSVSGIVTNEDNEPIVDSVVYVNEFVTQGGQVFTIEPTESVEDTSREEILETEFVVTDEDTNTSVTVTGAELQDFNAESQFSRVTQTNVSSFTLLTFPSEEQGQAQYTLPRVPAQDPNGVDYTRVVGIELDSGIQGVGDTDSEVQVDFTQEANVVIRGAVPTDGFFTMSDLSAPSTVAENETFAVSATVTNEDVVSATKTVEFRVSSGPLTGDTAVASQTVTLDPGESTTVTFDGLSMSEAGEYNHGVFSPDSAATATITVEESEQSIVEQFDTNDDGDISPDEAQDAIVALNNGEISPSEAQEIIVALNN